MKPATMSVVSGLRLKGDLLWTDCAYEKLLVEKLFSRISAYLEDDSEQVRRVEDGDMLGKALTLRKGPKTERTLKVLVAFFRVKYDVLLELSRKICVSAYVVTRPVRISS